MKRLTALLSICVFCTFLCNAQGFFDYSFSSSIRTPKGMYMFNGDEGVTDIPDSTMCEVRFKNALKFDPPEIVIKGIYVKKVGILFLFTSTSKLSFLVDINQNKARPLIPKKFIPIDTTSIKKITSEKLMYDIWRTNVFISNKDLHTRIAALDEQDRINAIENIKNWPYSNVESVLLKLTTDKNLGVAKSAKTALEYWRKTYLPLLAKY